MLVACQHYGLMCLLKEAGITVDEVNQSVSLYHASNGNTRDAKRRCLTESEEGVEVVFDYCISTKEFLEAIRPLFELASSLEGASGKEPVNT